MIEYVGECGAVVVGKSDGGGNIFSSLWDICAIFQIDVTMRDVFGIEGAMGGESG
jgi:hypothetical protein